MAKNGKGMNSHKGGQKFHHSALENLTSRIDKSLSGKKVAKRKDPPTNTNGAGKKQRNSDKAFTKRGGKDDQAALLAEIKALGGDESDLALINEVGSEDEDFSKDSEGPADKRLREELLALSKEFGFAEHAPSEASESDEAGQEDQNEEEGDAEVNRNGLSKEEEDEEDEEDDTLKGREKKRAGDLNFEPRADWHAAKLPKLPSPAIESGSPFQRAIQSLKTHADSLLEQDAAKYHTSIFAQSSHKFLTTVMSSGTLSDKVSALTLAVQESPVHNIRAFDALMNLASKKSRAQAIGALGALVDLLGPGAALPSDRRLRKFDTQPGLLGTLQKNGVKVWDGGRQGYPGKITDAHLISWAYEDWLKDTFFKVIQLLEVWCSDEIEYSRTKALDLVYGLLKEKPEQEANLLRLLVNKLGDRERKISSRASYLLLQLENSHPGMKPIIIRTIEQQILLHPSQDHRSKYYAINTLNQTILSSKEPHVAEHLIRIYFGIFVTLLKAGSLGIDTHVKTEDAKAAARDGKPVGRPKGKSNGKPNGKTKQPTAPEQETEAADKLVSAILTGVNRAAPFVGTEEAIMEQHLDTLFRIAHSANFNTGIQALLLIQHLSMSRHMASDRFYRTLYESLLDPRLVTSSKQALYLNLLLRALKNDVDVKRVKAFAKRMMQISSLHQPPFVCGLLYVMSQLRETFPDLSTLVNEPEESIFDGGESGEQRLVYDGRKRDPEHSNANRSCLWEAIPIQSHFHPSVCAIASALFDRQKKTPKPDMDSHSLIRFLDKFVYRNAKATDSARGTSIMQPLRAAKDVGDIWLGSKSTGKDASASINSAAFWNKKAEEVAAEDVFFHEYFQHMSKEPKMQAVKKDTEEDGEEAGEEDEIWKALVSSNPEVDGDIDDGSDVGFDDLDEADMASDGDESPGMDLDDSDFGDGLSDGSGVDIEGSDDDSEELVRAAEDEEEEEEDKEGGSKNNKKSSRKKMLKALPMFASVDDYAEMLEDDDSS